MWCAIGGALAIAGLAALLVVGIHAIAEAIINTNAGDED